MLGITVTIQDLKQKLNIGAARLGNMASRTTKKKTSTKKDACYHKVKRRYTKNGGTWPSAYASGALVKCRKVGAKNWGNKSKKNKA